MRHAFVRPRQKFSKISAAIWRPLPTPGPACQQQWHPHHEIARYRARCSRKANGVRVGTLGFKSMRSQCIDPQIVLNEPVLRQML